MGDALRVIVLGVIEGLTEFLPISSTGHLVVAMPLLGIDGGAPPWPAFLYFIQIGAIAAVVFHFRGRLWRHMLARPEAGWSGHLLAKLVVAMVPGALAGFYLNPVMEAHLEKPLTVAAALVVGAGIMIAVERACTRFRAARMEDVSLGQALAVGLAQCAAIIPGTSRAMATIMGGLAAGMPPPVAAEFSFYLAIPTLLGAGLLRIVKHWDDITGASSAWLALGFAVSFAVALAVVRVFMRYVQTRKLWPFAVYRVVLGGLIVVWWFCVQNGSGSP